jgi:hypothetical protein
MVTGSYYLGEQVFQSKKNKQLSINMLANKATDFFS